MTKNTINKIIIAGGGSAGWMTAAYLSYQHPELDITLIESSNTPIIGVGEATIAHLSRFLYTLKLKDSDWMPYCRATYKYGIKFNDWHEIGDEYWHPFEPFPYVQSQTNLATYWWYKYLNKKQPEDRNNLYTDCLLSTEIIKRDKIPRFQNAPEYNDSFIVKSPDIEIPVRIAYAYHFDAGLFGDFLKNKVALPNGVNHIIDDIRETRLDTDGNIKSLKTASGKTIKGDIFIDCTGFRSLLLEKSLKEPHISYADSLFCNRALAMHIPYTDTAKEQHPFTTATAKSSGWIWNTPLADSIGTGYVYCDSFIDDEKAEQEYRNHLGLQQTENIDVKRINIRVGRARNSWVNNCIAIGLSAGFVEPLESTGIHFIHVAIEKLSNVLQSKNYNCGDISAFNLYMKNTLEEARDMLSIHYALTNREDSNFWKEVKYNTKLSDTSAELLMHSQHRFPNNKQGYIFGNNSWICILNGMNYLPHDPFLHISEQELKPQLSYIKAMKTLQQELLQHSPLHNTYLSTMQKES